MAHPTCQGWGTPKAAQVAAALPAASLRNEFPARSVRHSAELAHTDAALARTQGEMRRLAAGT